MKMTNFKNTLWIAAILFTPEMAGAADGGSIAEAVTGGKVSLDMRYRIENVEQDNLLEEATASTLRTALGYTTGSYHGFSGYIEFEDVSPVGEDDYNSTVNGKTEFSVITDPVGEELNEVFLSYKGDDCVLKSGRQSMILDNARFIGNSGWRQNEQTFDMPVSYVNTGIENLKLTYGYMTAVQRVLGDASPVGEFNMSNHILNAGYAFDPFKVTAYAYFLEFDNPVQSLLSQQTLGASFSGTAGNFSYYLEYATQSDYADGSPLIDADYSLVELGYRFGGLTIKAAQETLGGDGTYGFSTPLATLHAFNGWADMFAVTPLLGLVDIYVDAATTAGGLGLKAVYHDFSSDTGGVDFGTEIDFLLSKKFSPVYSGGIKLASFSSDSAPAYADTDKVWLYVQANFAN
ncbi:MAG TPA: hypothetical protein VFX02_12810 [Gammaproteobacteria bacterium]|nr:hypothetical protein [Gammaproteobacteria bacterium]